MNSTDNFTWDKGELNSGEETVIAVSGVGKRDARKCARDADIDCMGREEEGRLR